MKVLKVNEPMCPRCGRGCRSGYPYPDCVNPPEGMTTGEAHQAFCSNYADDICAECYRERRLLNRGAR